MSFPFGSEFTVGIEEELFLVDEATLALAPVTDDVLDAMRVEPQAAGHDAYAAQIELRSPPGPSVADAVEALARLRAAATAAGATLLGAGLHPDGSFGEATLVEGHRYELVADQLRGLLRRTPESALHVHVGLPDERAATRAFNAMRLHVPLLVGLAANSPFWFGTDSGLCSARYVLSRAYPGRCVPRAVRDIEDLEELAGETLTAAGLPDGTFLWWDLRMHPRHGTLELREMDAQFSLEHAAAIAALVRALVVEAADGPVPLAVPSEALDWASFRAARDGTGAMVLDGDVTRPLADVVREAARRVRPIARDAGDEDALDGIGRVLEENGAARQCASFARGGMPELLRSLADETAAAGLPAARRS
ncbi:MAG TPA: YbdK family carboxylate-amine ligase [Gaiella sp.]|jgi:carboxylate-amine ligase